MVVDCDTHVMATTLLYIQCTLYAVVHVPCMYVHGHAIDTIMLYMRYSCTFMCTG